MNEFDRKNPDDALFKQMWANVGAESDSREWLMRLLHRMKKNHDEQIRRLDGEVGYCASFAAETRNIVDHKTTKNDLKSDLALHYVSAMLKKGGGDGIEGYGDQTALNNISEMLDDRRKMEKARDGGIPTIYQAKDVLKGKSIETIHKKATVETKIVYSGKYYNQESSGFSQEEEKERRIERKRSNNAIISKKEKDAFNIEKEWKKSKLDKESDGERYRYGQT